MYTDNLITTTARHISEEMFFQDAKVLLCVSGGPDSMAMLDIVAQILTKEQIYVITIDHKIRPEAQFEAIKVKEYSHSLGISHVTIGWPNDWPIAKNQEEARKGRYTLIFQYAREINAFYIVTAHHFDDIVENFFIRAGRGSGIKGLNVYKRSAIHGKYKIIRPFFEVTKQEILEYLKTKNIQYATDLSNFSSKYLRSRLRQSLTEIIKDLPSIKTTLNNISSAYDSFSNEYYNKIIHVLKFLNLQHLYISRQNFEILQLEEKKRLISDIIRIFGKASHEPRLKSIEAVLDKIQDNKGCTAGYIKFKPRKNIIEILPEISRKIKL